MRRYDNINDSDLSKMRSKEFLNVNSRDKKYVHYKRIL